VKISYRLRAPVLALKRDGGERPNLQTLAPGSLITVTSEMRESGLVDVAYSGGEYTVFYDDVRERGEMAAGA
jgi:hypothetical protein